MTAPRPQYLVPYANPQDAARAKKHALWAAAIVGLAYAGAVVVMMLSNLNDPATNEGTTGTAGGGAYTVTSVLWLLPVLLTQRAQRQNLQRAAGRKLYNFEIAEIANYTAAGRIVDDTELVLAQEYYTRRHMNTGTAIALSGAAATILVGSLVAFLALGLLPA